MNITARIVDAIVTIPHLGKQGQDAAGNTINHCGRLTVHVYAVPAGTVDLGYHPENILLGQVDFNGFSSDKFSRSVRIVLPYGMKVVAIPVDESGAATLYQELPVCLEEVSVEGKGLEPFALSGGRVFIAAGQFAVNSDSEENRAEKLKAIIAETVVEQLKKEMQPGGLLHRR